MAIFSNPLFASYSAYARNASITGLDIKATFVIRHYTNNLYMQWATCYFYVHNSIQYDNKFL